jgi:hypothetical protein
MNYVFFFFFLNQFIFRNTSLRLGPVCIYEPIQFERHGNDEVPTRRVSETETNRSVEKGVIVNEEPRLGDLKLHAEAMGVQQALQPNG